MCNVSTNLGAIWNEWVGNDFKAKTIKTKVKKGIFKYLWINLKNADFWL